jgi:Ni2+-binding GTPase involved in maturation of urease and hydrogenase
MEKLNPNIKVILISAKTDEGIREGTDWVLIKVKIWKRK